MSRFDSTEESMNDLTNQALEQELKLSEEDKEAQKLKEEKFEEMREKYTVEDCAEFLEIELQGDSNLSIEKTISLLEFCIVNLYFEFGIQDPEQPVIKVKNKLRDLLFELLDDVEHYYMHHLVCNDIF